MIPLLCACNVLSDFGSRAFVVAFLSLVPYPYISFFLSCFRFRCCSIVVLLFASLSAPEVSNGTAVTILRICDMAIYRLFFLSC